MLIVSNGARQTSRRCGGQADRCVGKRSNPLHKVSPRWARAHFTRRKISGGLQAACPTDGLWCAKLALPFRFLTCFEVKLCTQLSGTEEKGFK